MGEQGLFVAREYLLVAKIAPSRVRRVFQDYGPVYAWRVLWLDAETLQAICWHPLDSYDHVVDADHVLDFARQADSELLKISRICSILHDAPVNPCALGERFAYLVSSGHDVRHFVADKRIRPAVPVVEPIFHPKVMPLLASRSEGVRIFHEASQSASDGRKTSEYFRLIEAGFSLKGGRLLKPLLNFLATGEFSISADTWVRLKSLRDRLNHAYRSGEIAYDADAAEDVNLLRSIAADVLVHKENWGKADAARLQESYIAVYQKPDGGVVLTRGFPFKAKMAVNDAITGMRLHLAPQKFNARRRRYLRVFNSVQERSGKRSNNNL